MNFISRFFQFEHHKTNYKTEITAGITTFFTMAYIIFVHPKVLESAGIPFGASMLATFLTAIFGTLLMGFYAKKPFAIAPYMGENAFIAFTVIIYLKIPWQLALWAIFISGIIFTILTLTKIRKWLVEAIPMSLKHSFTAGIGLFLTFIGLKEAGIIKLGVIKGAPPQIGDLSSIPVLLAIFTFVIIGILIIRKVKSALLLGIIISSIIAISLNYLNIIDNNTFKNTIDPGKLDFNLENTRLKLDFSIFTSYKSLWDVFTIILIIFVMTFVDTIGTLLGVSARAGFLDKNGNLPQIEKPMLADALVMIFAPLVGTTAAGTFIESASGVEVGGRTGFTALITALLFIFVLILLIMLPFLRSFFAVVPPEAYGPALIIIGLFMLSSIKKINFKDYTESIPAFTVIVLMSFTYNIGIGITGGFILYPFFKVISGKQNDIHPGLLVLSALSLLFFIFYPYK